METTLLSVISGGEACVVALTEDIVVVVGDSEVLSCSGEGGARLMVHDGVKLDRSGISR